MPKSGPLPTVLHSNSDVIHKENGPVAVATCNPSSHVAYAYFLFPHVLICIQEPRGVEHFWY